ncbi:M28 family peptidase [Maribacter sp. 2307ULW6-5]|uniref:M28 family peptidase n=1 Tax=Maribacter sp. 2307ULW6-5 TaxID=3386275 RepID=UPI0039BCA6D8
MNKTFFILAGSLLMACNSSQKTVKEQAVDSASPTVYAQTITEEELKEHLYIYASDEFEGRDTGAPGQKKAVEYLRNAYQEMNVPAAKSDGDYFQKVPLEISKLPTGGISVNGATFSIGNDVLTFEAAEGSFNELVYVGYGIEEDGYSDYDKVNVQGKPVLIKAGEPMDAEGNYVISGTSEKSVWSNMSESLGKRLELAKEKGATAVFYFDADNFNRFKRRFDSMKSNDSGRMSLKDNGSAPFYNFFINETMAKALMPNIGTDHSPQELSATLQLAVESSNEEIDSENVVAVIKGSTKPNEYVVISSHLDHIGVTPDGQINNGADDDGSGTVAMLEIAEAFQEAVQKGNGPERSIVFLHVTAEEKGLLGSQYYTDTEPIFPLAQTVANLNIDMIGRIDPKREGDRNYLYLIGSDKLSTELHELSEMVNNKYTNIEFDYTYNDPNDPNRFYYRSDHYNFAKNNIPIIFYFNGTHDDYHRPSDTVEKINYDLLENRSRLIFYTAWEIANRDKKLVVDKAEAK